MLENEWLLSEKFYHFRCVSKASSDMLRASVEIQKKPFVCNIQLEVVVTMQTLLHATILPFLLVVVAVCLLHANFYGLLHSMSDDYIFAIASIDNNNRRWITMIKHQTFIQFEWNRDKMNTATMTMINYTYCIKITRSLSISGHSKSKYFLYVFKQILKQFRRKKIIFYSVRHIHFEPIA